MNEDKRLGTVRPLVVPEIVTFPAEVDVGNSRSLGAELRAAVRPGVAVVIADLTRTEFCDSSAIRYLLIAHDHAQSQGAELRLVVRSSAVVRIMRVIGVDQVLAIYGDMAAALAQSPTAR